MEKGLRQTKIYELPIIVALRIMFAAAGIALQPFGMGYQIYFVYQKPEHSTPPLSNRARDLREGSLQ